MKIMANRMDLGFRMHQDEYEEAALRVLRSGWYILGKEVEAFESEYAAYHGEGFSCAGVANGLDALVLAIRAMGIGEGDEVIVQGNTYIASVMGISINGATPVFVEPDEHHQIDVDRIEAAITDKTKAVMVVHLYGHICDMDKVVQICKKHGLKLVEDCAQSHGARWKGKLAGTFGDAGCFSFYPSKNIGAFGDAGAVISPDPELIGRIKVIRNYGSGKRYYNEVVGVNSRLDEMQAALLRVRMKYIDEITEERRKIAAVYNEKIVNPAIIKPVQQEGGYEVYHQYVIRTEKRDELIEYLKDKEIGTIIHYPVPPHLQQAYEYLGHKKGELPICERYANEVLSLPIYNGMTDEEQQYVIDALNVF
ncbi:MAG: DegT/DnrJ/EryC1/StrS family aminotransferase [Lachnospiraceae bacterium]|nr:DegT/DnrJ/EryC1/StrS family aminotransferase [Lachnospiraceae bacterium]